MTSPRCSGHMSSTANAPVFTFANPARSRQRCRPPEPRPQAMLVDILVELGWARGRTIDELELGVLCSRRLAAAVRLKAQAHAQDRPEFRAVAKGGRALRVRGTMRRTPRP